MVPIEVHVTETPTDIIAVLSALFAAFFGAAAAFWLNAIHERTQERRKRRELINKSSHDLILTLESFINLKKQFLVGFEAEFRTAYERLAEGVNPNHQSKLAALFQEVNIIFQEIGKKDAQLCSIFKKWDGIEFPNLSAANDLGFVVDGDSDLLRLLFRAQSTVSAAARTIRDRNLHREKKVDNFLSPPADGSIDPRLLLFWFEMIDFRFVILQHTNIALVLIVESLKRIEIYRKKHFPHRRKLAQLFYGAESWITYSLPEKSKHYLPEQDTFKNILELVE
jgi:hypothetical protein